MTRRHTNESKHFYKVRNPIRILLTGVLVLGSLIDVMNILDQSTEKDMHIVLLLLGLSLALETMVNKKYYEKYYGFGNVNTTIFLLWAIVIFQITEFF